MRSIGSKTFPVRLEGYSLGYNQEFREKMKDYLDTFKEGSHQCTVLKKVVTSINTKTGNTEKRVLYIFDDRHIKSFRKRIDKCKGKG